MLDIRLADLRDEDAYYLDNAQDSGEITPLAWAALLLFGDRDEIAEIIDLKRPGYGWRWKRGQACFEIEMAAHRILNQIPDRLQRAFFAFALCRYRKTMLDLVDFLAGSNFEDSVRGGAMKPYRHYVRHHRDMTPTPRARRTLYAPAAIRRYLRIEDQSIPHQRRLLTRWRGLAWPEELSEGQPVIEMIAGQSRAIRARVEAGCRVQYDRVMGIGRRTVPKAERKVLARAATTAVALLGGAPVKDFIQGTAAVLHGELFDYEVSRRRRLGDVGHGALEIAICDKGGDRLANLCCYFQRIPALDQLTALGLHVSAGNELDVLDTGNLYAVTPLGSQHPVLSERYRPPVSTGLSERDKLRIAVDDYARSSHQLYFDALGIEVWGRDWARARPFIEGIAA